VQLFQGKVQGPGLAGLADVMQKDTDPHITQSIHTSSCVVCHCIALARALQGVQEHGASWLWFAILSCSFMGCLLNYALFWCTATNTALTTTIVGVLKGVVSVALGERPTKPYA